MQPHQMFELQVVFKKVAETPERHKAIPNFEIMEDSIQAVLSKT